jgi:hypothetical protein
MYRYVMLLRPASSCTLPAGLKWDYAEVPREAAHWLAPRRPELPISKHPHGVISTERALTREECERFDLQPVIQETTMQVSFISSYQGIVDYRVVDALGTAHRVRLNVPERRFEECSGGGLPSTAKMAAVLRHREQEGHQPLMDAPATTEADGTVIELPEASAFYSVERAREGQ